MTVTIYLDVSRWGTCFAYALPPPGAAVVGSWPPAKMEGITRYKVEVLVDDPAEPDATAPAKATKVPASPAPADTKEKTP